MKLVIQRVQKADVAVSGKIISEIKRGFLILLGVSEQDTEDDTENDSEQESEQVIEWLAKKCSELRIFPDENGLMNLSIKDVGGEVLLISQFTLYANCSKGRRPSFVQAARPEKAERLYLQFAKALKEKGVTTKMGIFGADMKVSLINDGPVTIILEK